MTDEVKKEESNEGVAIDETKTSIDRAKLAELEAKVEEYDKLNHIAKAADFENPKAYIENLEDNNWDKLNEAVATEEKKEEPKEEVKPSGLSDEDKLKIQQGNTNAILAAQWATYKVDQSELPKENKSPVTKTELDKLIYSKSTGLMIGQLAQEFDGNVYAAANHYLSIKDVKVKANKEGAESQKALDAAAASTELGTGGKPQEIEKKTSEEKAAEENTQRADEIYPDHKYDYTGP